MTGNHDPLAAFSAATRLWFGRTFSSATRAQQLGWAAVGRGLHTLLLAPTGSGKTLAAFLFAIDRLFRPSVEEREGVTVLYVSPLKALVVDVERNLRAPLAGIQAAAHEIGATVASVRVGIRTGDTSTRDRESIRKHPPDILVTTPESLYLMLTSQSRASLRSVEVVIIDEVHALVGTKRGAHLALSLERLSALCEREPQRIGLSATVRPISTAAEFLGGDRPVEVANAIERPRLDVQVVSPLERLDRPGLSLTNPPGEPSERSDGNRFGIWPHVFPVLYDLVRAHTTTIAFSNSRKLAEKVTEGLNELAASAEDGQTFARAHHGSISREQREEVETSLKSGKIRCISSTSSLELGIDMGHVDLVVQLGCPPSVASGLQRVGRAGHQVGGTSRARVFPRTRQEALQTAALVQCMVKGELEEVHMTHNALDVLAQQLVAICCTKSWTPSHLLGLVRRAGPYRNLPEAHLMKLLEVLTGDLAPGLVEGQESAFRALRPRLRWDRTLDLVSAREGTAAVVFANPGTIPDRGVWPVYLAPAGPRLGELDEEMVFESRKGDTFLLGASSWRIVDITRDRVLVEPAPGERAQLPFWRGENQGKGSLLGERVGALARTLLSIDPPTAQTLLAQECRCDENSIANIRTLLADQVGAGAVPTDRELVVEITHDELGDWQVFLLSPFGYQVHATLATALSGLRAERGDPPAQLVWSDSGIILRLPRELPVPAAEELLPGADRLEELLLQELPFSQLFATAFRENAGRALLLPRRRPGQRIPLWLQRLRAHDLLEAARNVSDWPIFTETLRECLQDRLDLAATLRLLRAVEQRQVVVREVRGRRPSPMAREMIQGFVASFLYEGDAPLAERRAQALVLDKEQLHSLMGASRQTCLFEELDWKVLDRELEPVGLAGLSEARQKDEVENRLRTRGEVPAHLAAADPLLSGLLVSLQSEGRVHLFTHTARPVWIWSGDATRYARCFGPEAEHNPIEKVRALEQLYLRWTAYQPGFDVLTPGLWWGQPEFVLRDLAQRLENRGLLSRVLRDGRELLVEKEVLRRLKRISLQRIKQELRPVSQGAFAAFVADWQGVVRDGLPSLTLPEVCVRLEGLPVCASELESTVIPARAPGYQAGQLDMVLAEGDWLYQGAGTQGARDGWLRLIRRERIELFRNATAEAYTGAAAQVLAMLHQRGSAFFAEIRRLDGRVGESTHQEAGGLEAALWTLLWSGAITNDTLAPIRYHVSASSNRGRPLTGRWSPVTDAAPPPNPIGVEQRILAEVELWLSAYGIVTSEAPALFRSPFGFGDALPVLQALEEKGRVQRGYYFEGQQGLAFALPAAVDRLRSLRDDRSFRVLSTTDPACAWGSLLPWPIEAQGQIRREPGGILVSLGGYPLIWLARGGASLVCLAGSSEELPRAVALLTRTVELRAERNPTIQRLNGQSAGPANPLFGPLRAAGMLLDSGGLRLPVRL